MKSRITEILAKGKTEKAIKLLFEETNKSVYKKSEIRENVILLSGRFYKTKDDYLIGLITDESYRVEVNKINKGILHFLEKLPEKNIEKFEDELESGTLSKKEILETRQEINKEVRLIYYKSKGYLKLSIELTNKLKELHENQDLSVEQKEALLNKVYAIDNITSQYENDILNLYEVFNHININTSRLTKAKELFLDGKIEEADLMLSVKELGDEQRKLIELIDKNKEDLKDDNSK